MYSNIEPIPSNHHELASPELTALAQVWRDQKTSLEVDEAYQEFLKKLQREWAIETGIIERLYRWDRGVTEVLIEQGIDSALIAHGGGLKRDEAEHVKDLIDDQLATIEYVFAFVKNEQPLTEHFIRSLHSRFTVHQEYTEARTPDGTLVRVPLIKGAYKTHSNNPRRDDGTLHEYCPPEFVNDEMQRLVHWYQEYSKDVSPEVLSTWLHHRFTQIHPFQDGNGRVARALASLVFLKAGLFPLVIRDEDRVVYIDTLEKADQGELQDLVRLFTIRQRDSILKALGIEQRAREERYADEIIRSAVQVLKDNLEVETTRKEKVYSVAEQLRLFAYERLKVIAEKINEQLEELKATNPPTDYHAWTGSADYLSPQSYAFSYQIVEVAKQFGYFPSFERYRSWVRLSIKTAIEFEFIMSLHGYGKGANGIIAASAFTSLRVEHEADASRAIDTRPACFNFFQFNYAEEEATIKSRFADWLEHATAIALSRWRSHLGS